MAMNALFKTTYHAQEYNRHRDSRDRLVVRTLRCGRSNPGSNPGHGSVLRCYGSGDFPFEKLYFCQFLYRYLLFYLKILSFNIIR